VLELCESDSVVVLRPVTLATPCGNPGCLPLSNPTKCRKLGLDAHKQYPGFLVQEILVTPHDDMAVGPAIVTSTRKAHILFATDGRAEKQSLIRLCPQNLGRALSWRTSNLPVGTSSSVTQDTYNADSVVIHLRV
jgi:hypothetical protein